MVVYFAFAALLFVSSVIDFAHGHGKLGLIELLIGAFLLLGAMALRRRERLERLMPVEEPPPRWY